MKSIEGTKAKADHLEILNAHGFSIEKSLLGCLNFQVFFWEGGKTHQTVGSWILGFSQDLGFRKQVLACSGFTDPVGFVSWRSPEGKNTDDMFFFFFLMAETIGFDHV